MNDDAAETTPQAQLANADRQIANLADIYSALKHADAEAERAQRPLEPYRYVSAAGRVKSFEEIGISDAEAFAAARVYARAKLKSRADSVRQLLTGQYGVNVAQMAALDRAVAAQIDAMFHVERRQDRDDAAAVGGQAGTP